MALEKPDLHHIALHASNHLTAFEETSSSETPILDDMRAHFLQELKVLHRKEYYPRLDHFVAQEKKGHRPPQVETPVITENVDLNQLMFLLFERFTNLKGLLYQYYKQSGKYDSQIDFGIQIEPFINKVSHEDIRSITSDLLPKDFDPTDDAAFMNYVDQIVAVIHEKKLSGTQHNFLPKKIRTQRKTSEYRNVVRNYIRSMGQHYERLQKNPQGPKIDIILEDIRKTLASLLCANKINELSYEGLEHLSYSDILTVYADEIALALGIRVDPVAEDNRLDFEFAPRTIDYIDVGTRYGDCTSRNKQKQVDEVPNIFWTIASYATDIFHQVQELRIDGDPLMKTHLTPCFFRGEPALNVDAFEATLKIRDYKSNKDPIPNEACDTAIFARRKEFFDLTFERIRQLADAMGIETILCDGYSNTQWVRSEIEEFPSTIYHMNEYHSLYDGTFPRDFAKALLQVSVSMRMEVQALNSAIWDQGLRPHYKMNRIIRGSAFDSKGAIRGV